MLNNNQSRENPESYCGSCLCGQITYQLNQSYFEPLAHCHCTMCRKFHGAAFASLMTVDKSKLVFLSGESLLKTFECERDSVKTKRRFCGECGSSLLFESSFNTEQNTVELAIASLDQPIEIFVDGHIYTKDKANWFDINDTLPKYSCYRGSELA
ncbi:GFA family protein [Marinicellulosiphila megalodicopiae]|uniref:GFA family protein n=1 Tax=Marinicellulosiphila megalodicopiae TaxID=2724896 RepID=UPI003BAEFCC1